MLLEVLASPALLAVRAPLVPLEVLVVLVLLELFTVPALLEVLTPRVPLEILAAPALLNMIAATALLKVLAVRQANHLSSCSLQRDPKGKGPIWYPIS